MKSVAKVAKVVKLRPREKFHNFHNFRNCCETVAKVAKVVKPHPAEFHSQRGVSQPGGSFTTPWAVKLPGVDVHVFAMGG